MDDKKNILRDSYGRNHGYLRISLIEKCNLRCSYCMPKDGIPLSPKSHLMTDDEIYKIAKIFVANGVSKIRLTGGEPLIRKDFSTILERLSSLPVTLSITSNAIIIDRFIDVFKANHLLKINLSLDTLDPIKFKKITRRDQFEKVYKNLFLLIKEGFEVKVNVVLMNGFNDNEIIDFIELTKKLPISIRFIEFMPFDGNSWNVEKMVSYKAILERVQLSYQHNKIIRLQDAQNDTTKNYKIAGHLGSFGIISSVTNPFCDSCNRLRLTANGKLKNCLFSAGEADVLTALRSGTNIEPIIARAVKAKFKVRGGMDSLKKLQEPERHTKNRSMIAIGG